MPSPTYTIIREAIAKKQHVIATYDGHNREMCPHVIGYKDGVEQALFYQFAGNSSKGKITKDSEKTWRCMSISKLQNVSVREGEWHTSEDHSKRQTCVDRVDLEVAH
jgi:hypothetical protein